MRKCYSEAERNQEAVITKAINNSIKKTKENKAKYASEEDIKNAYNRIFGDK